MDPAVIDALPYASGVKKLTDPMAAVKSKPKMLLEQGK
jgi:hypothetical protein